MLKFCKPLFPTYEYGSEKETKYARTAVASNGSEKAYVFACRWVSPTSDNSQSKVARHNYCFQNFDHISRHVSVHVFIWKGVWREYIYIINFIKIWTNALSLREKIESTLTMIFFSVYIIYIYVYINAWKKILVDGKFPLATLLVLFVLTNDQINTPNYDKNMYIYIYLKYKVFEFYPLSINN